MEWSRGLCRRLTQKREVVT